jgi:ketosteroid isomerase-like protein
MSVQQIEAAAQAFADAFNRSESPAVDIPALAELLDEDLEVFDTVPYRFDNKKQFVDFLQGAASGLASSTFGFRQLSCRVFNDISGTANAYDSFTGVTKDGQVRIVHGRTTLVFAKRGSQWKIVSAHFSHLPHTP